MPDNEFSEFTFAFAFTQEVTALCWHALQGAPEMPSLFDEGQGKGFDASLALWGWTIFAQFKRGSLLTRSNAREWQSYASQYFRFGIYADSQSSQHRDLLAIEAESLFHWPVYVSPVFHTRDQLNTLFMSQVVRDHVRLITPGSIGHLDDIAHYVTYQSRFDNPMVHSEPFEIESLSVRAVLDQVTEPAPSVRDVSAAEGELGQGPRVLDASYFDRISERMLAIGAERAGGRYRDAVELQVADMSAFGRARTVGRLLYDSELIALPAGGQSV